MAGSEYPKWLHHPGFSPAVISEGAAGGPLIRGAHYAGVGKPAQFPPVIVRGPDDEAWHVARGYAPGAYDQAKVDRQTIAPLPNGYREQEYPRVEADGSITPDPNPEPIDTREFPKWVPGPDGDEIAQNAAEEAAILARAGRKPEPKLEVVALAKDELAAFRAWQAARQSNNPPEGPGETASPEASRPTGEVRRRGHAERGTAEHRELVRLCRMVGIKVDGRWPLARLRAAYEEGSIGKEIVHADDEKGEHAGKEAAVQEGRGIRVGRGQIAEDRGDVGERRGA